MVEMRAVVAAGAETAAALSGLTAELAQGVALEPDFVCIFHDSAHDAAAIFAFARQQFPRAAIMGGTSCAGVMSQHGIGGAGSVGLLLVEDPDGDYGTAGVALAGDIAGCAEQALHAALDAAGCAGELPELVWIYQAPGQEEAVIAGLRRVVGDRCPIIGGSSADNEVAGAWQQIGPAGAMTGGLVVGVLFSSGGIGFAFQGGYEPGGASGIVTAVGGDCGPAGGLPSGVVTRARGRQLIAIDGQPAAEVYNRWIGGGLDELLADGGNILKQTTMFPVGIDAGKVEGITNYLLIHPDRILAGGALSTFAEIEEGTRLYSMRGNRGRLIQRAGKVAAAAAATLPGGSRSLAGGLVVYCAGCMLAVGEADMPGVSTAISDSFGGMPFLGCFTFGEQGAMLGRNAHGNLMISAVAFGR